VTKLTFAVSTFILCSGASAFAADVPPIEKLVPDKTVVLVGVKNMDGTMERMKKTGLWQLWDNPKMKDAFASTLKDMTTDLDKMYEELGVEKDSLVPPSGAVGFAMFSVMNEELGTPEMGFLMTADYGDNADKTAKLIEASLAKGEKDGKLEVEVKETDGRTITTIDLSKMQEQAEPDDGMDDMDGMGENPVEAFGGDITKMHFVREGNTFILSSSMTSLADALDTVDGKGKTGVTDRAEFVNLSGKVGDGDAYGFVFTRDIMDMVAPMDQMGIAQMMVPTIRTMVGKVDGYGWGMKLDGTTAMAEQRLAVLMPDGKAGLTSLMDTPLPAGKLPAFVGPDAISYSAFNFEFAGLMEVIRKVVNSNPMLAMQAGEMLPQIEPIVNQFTATMGSQVHRAGTLTRPLTETSSQSLMGIECIKPQDFENLFGGMAGQMGLESRDFLGQRIYSMDPAMMGDMMPMGGGPTEPISIGLGGGFILIGSTPAVEQSLRASGQAEQASLSSNAEFQRAVATINRDNAVAWGYYSTVDSMEAQMFTQKAAMKSMIDSMKEFDPEMAAEAEKEMQESMKMFDAFDFAEIRKIIGPSAWQVSSVEDGYVAEFFLLNAGEK